MADNALVDKARVFESLRRHRGRGQRACVALAKRLRKASSESDAAFDIEIENACNRSMTAWTGDPRPVAERRTLISIALIVDPFAGRGPQAMEEDSRELKRQFGCGVESRWCTRGVMACALCQSVYAGLVLMRVTRGLCRRCGARG